MKGAEEQDPRDAVLASLQAAQDEYARFLMEKYGDSEERMDWMRKFIQGPWPYGEDDA